MKFLRLHEQGLVIKPSHFIQTLTPYPLTSIPFCICIKRRFPPSISSSISSNRQKTCFTGKSIHLHLMTVLSSPLPCFAAVTEQSSARINIESVLVSIDDFFNRYPYFVASLAFVWLVVIPLTEEYLNKFKFISCIDAFRKLRDDPSTQLLDIRKKQSVMYLKTPNLKILNKGAVNLEFVEGCEEEFVKDVLNSFQDPERTIICVLDNFDGNSLEVAKLLFKNGFKEVYAIKGGMLGKDGWQAIQKTLLPPSIHVYPKKKRRQPPDQVNGKQKENNEDGRNMQLLNSFSNGQKVIENAEDGNTESRNSSLTSNGFRGRPLSPYPNYIDLKPPSSPTPSNSQS